MCIRPASVGFGGPGCLQPHEQIPRPQDITPPERVQRDPTCDREVAVYGYLRGCNMKRGMRVHLAGVGDYTVRVLPPV